MNLNERLNYLEILEYLTSHKGEKVSASNKKAAERYVKLKKQLTKKISENTWSI